VLSGELIGGNPLDELLSGFTLSWRVPPLDPAP
jgi:hypothetical protein